MPAALLLNIAASALNFYIYFRGVSTTPKFNLFLGFFNLGVSIYIILNM